MKNSNIDDLIKKYWEGETSLEEESEIKKILKNNENQEYAELKTMFAFFDAEKDIRYPGIIKSKKNKIVKGSFIKSIAVAASIILLIGAGIYFYTDNTNKKIVNISSGEIQDPEEALKITKEALAFLSVNYNKGQESISGTIGNLEKLDIIKSN
ncbi:MAG: hypothetical protein IPH57_16895 [Saprospiraceae bacterium]|nr:hypothetical protein [Saprospiraceae bacterium]